MTTASLVPSRCAAESGAARVDRVVVVVGVMNASAMHATSSTMTDENRRHGCIVRTTQSVSCDTTRKYEYQASIRCSDGVVSLPRCREDSEKDAGVSRLATSSSSVARHGVIGNQLAACEILASKNSERMQPFE